MVPNPWLLAGYLAAALLPCMTIWWVMRKREHRRQQAASQGRARTEQELARQQNLHLQARQLADSYGDALHTIVNLDPCGGLDTAHAHARQALATGDYHGRLRAAHTALEQAVQETAELAVPPSVVDAGLDDVGHVLRWMHHLQLLPSPLRVIMVLPPGEEHRLDGIARALSSRGLSVEDAVIGPNRAVTCRTADQSVIRCSSALPRDLLGEGAPSQTGLPDNCPPPPAADGVGLFWDNCGNFAMTSTVDADGTGRAQDTWHVCGEAFGAVTGASVLAAVSADGAWRWRCVSCRSGEVLTRFGLCPTCSQRESASLAAGCPF